MSDECDPGLYWVRGRFGGWTVAQLSTVGGRWWTLIGNDTPFDDATFTAKYEIGPEAEPPR